jgi:hypothetical protein
MKGLNKHEFLLALSQQLDTFLIVRYDHTGIDLMSLLLSLDLKVLPALLELLDPQTLSFDSKLEVELPALLE